MSTNKLQPRLGGIAEVAAELGVSRQQVSKLRAGPDFPEPIAELAVGAIWNLDIVRRWAGSGLRRGPGRPAVARGQSAVGRRFELREVIRQGGFAEIYLARDLESTSSADVAVKVLSEVTALDQEMVDRFKRELGLLGELDDPHVVRVLASGTDEHLGLWYAMPLAQWSLADALGERRDTAEIVEIMREICAGLAYVHSKGILHRDLKPENVLRTADGTWALADFGLARAIAEDEIRLTRTFEQMGTKFYTAPEQWVDAKRVDERTDIFSTGKVLQALVQGGTPVDDTVPQHVLRPVILKAIDHVPNRRYQSVAELLAAIETAVAKPDRKWENPDERAERLRERLHERLGGPRSADDEALAELLDWAEEVDPADYEEMGRFATTLCVLSERTIRWWWETDRPGFTRMFEAFAERLCGSFAFSECDCLANFARHAVNETEDIVILREAIRGLVSLGQYHNRWHVRDVAVSILQRIRTDEDAVAAVEGLRAADLRGVAWTVGETAVRTLHPILRAGVGKILDEFDQLYQADQGSNVDLSSI